MTRHHITTSLLMGVVLLIGFVGTASAEIPQVISYQGKVMDTSGNPVADGNYTMRFRIYDAVTVGTLKWDSGAQVVAVAGGVFSVLLGESLQPALGLDFSQDYWLLVTFNGVDQTPRQRMASTGYSYMASGLMAGTEVSGVVGLGTLAALKGTNTAPSGTVFGLAGECSSPSGRGVYGRVTATSGDARGVYGRSSSSAGTGVYGYADATTGDTNGVYGLCSSNDGIGVYGLANATTGTTYGVFGSVASTNGRGVCGEATATSGGARAVYGRSYSNAGTGVFGYASATTGTTYGGSFESASPQGVGIRAKGGASGYAGVFEGNVAVKSLTSGTIVIELGEGLDYAEGFNVSGSGETGPGTVLVIDDDHSGVLSPSCRPYDTRVAGVVAGANGVGSGVRLGADQFDCDVALAGRVYCNVDATEAGIEPGDLLTTCATPGYAMKATDHQRAQGAILGKAMERLERGRKAQILVLVTLQ